MATVYGSIIKSLWRAYLDYDTTKTDTTVKITASSGFYCYAHNYKVSNWSNALSFAGTSVDTASSKSVYVGGTTGSKYKKTSYSKTYTRKTSAYTVVLKGSFVNRYTAGSAPGTSNATVTITIPALSKYTISYNANGGTGTVSAQTKYYGEAITLKDGTGLSRTNYTFMGWNTEADGTGTDYVGEYSTNANLTLYAKWKLNAYTLTFNDGTGLQEKTVLAGDIFNFSEIGTPTKAGHLFIGWGFDTSQVAYKESESYIPTKSQTWYAVWMQTYRPSLIGELLVTRTDSDGIEDDNGTHAKVFFSIDSVGQFYSNGAWANVSREISVLFMLGGAVIHSASNIQSGYQVPNGVFAIDKAYTVILTIADKWNGEVLGEYSLSDILTKAAFTIDVNANGDSVAFFTTASDTDHKVVNVSGTIKTEVVNVSGTIKTTDIQLGLDNNAGSGTDFEIYSALQTLGWTDCII